MLYMTMSWNGDGPSYSVEGWIVDYASLPLVIATLLREEGNTSDHTRVGYGDLPLLEYDALFARMLHAGARAVNLAEPLVFCRSGAQVFKRCGGTAPLRSELGLLHEFRRRGFTSRPAYPRNVIVRGRYRCSPGAAAVRHTPGWWRPTARACEFSCDAASVRL
jgi:hypothetical protein